MGNSKELYHFYKGLGICVNCRKRNAVEGKTRCHECLCDLAISVEKNRNEKTEEEKELIKEKNRLHMRELREQKKKDGICQWCNQPLSKYSNLFCVDCRVKSMKRNRKRDRSLAN